MAKDVIKDSPPFYALNLHSFYQNTAKFRKVSGLSVCILRAVHDQLWQSDFRYLTPDVLCEKLDIDEGIWEEAFAELVKAKFLVVDREGYVSSPDIDECWNFLVKQSDRNRANVMKRYENNTENQ